MSQTVQLSVPADWKLPAFYSATSPGEVAVALDAAAGLVPWVTQLVHAHKDEQEEARRWGVDEAVQAALRHLRNESVEQALQEKHDVQMQIYDVRTQLESSKMKVVELTQAVHMAERRVADAEARGRASAILECDGRLKVELKHADDRRTALEAELRHRAAEAAAERDALRSKCEHLEQAQRQLQADNSRLTTPSGRGEAGEADVQAILGALGYRIYDTSKCKDKDKYGDLLCVLSDDEETEPSTTPHRGTTRLAVEVKNRANVRTADVASFEKKVQEGVQNGLFEGGLFVSLRCHIPGMTSCAKQQLLPDKDGRPTVPMACVCAERGTPPRPVLAEHVEIVVQAHMHLCEQVAEVRHAMGGGERSDVDVARVQEHFVELSTFTTDMFGEFAKHHAILESARKSLDAMKQACLTMYRTARRLNLAVPWLQQPMAQLTCERGLDHAVKLASEGRLNWPSVSNRESVFQTLGKDCATVIVNEELRRLGKEAAEHRDKRPRE